MAILTISKSKRRRTAAAPADAAIRVLTIDEAEAVSGARRMLNPQPLPPYAPQGW